METPNPDILPEPMPDTDALLAELQREVALDRVLNKRRNQLLSVQFFLAVAWAGAMLLGPHFWRLQILFLTAQGICSLGSTFFVSRVRTRQKKRSESRRALIGKLKMDVRAVGDLAVLAVGAQEGTYCTVCCDALRKMLPRLQASDAHFLTSEQMVALIKILNRFDNELVVATLKGLQQVGDERAVAAVEKLAEKAKKKQVREAAKECLPFLRIRAVERQKELTLLRPSSATSAMPETLLRPASAATTPEAKEQLLRPVE